MSEQEVEALFQRFEVTYATARTAIKDGDPNGAEAYLADALAQLTEAIQGYALPQPLQRNREKQRALSEMVQ